MGIKRKCEFVYVYVIRVIGRLFEICLRCFRRLIRLLRIIYLLAVGTVSYNVFPSPEESVGRTCLVLGERI